MPLDVEAVKESLKKTPARRRVVSTDEFTEVNAETSKKYLISNLFFVC